MTTLMMTLPGVRRGGLSKSGRQAISLRPPIYIFEHTFGHMIAHSPFQVGVRDHLPPPHDPGLLGARPSHPPVPNLTAAAATNAATGLGPAEAAIVKVRDPIV